MRRWRCLLLSATYSICRISAACAAPYEIAACAAAYEVAACAAPYEIAACAAAYEIAACAAAYEVAACAAPYEIAASAAPYEIAASTAAYEIAASAAAYNRPPRLLRLPLLGARVASSFVGTHSLGTLPSTAPMAANAPARSRLAEKFPWLLSAPPVFLLTLCNLMEDRSIESLKRSCPCLHGHLCPYLHNAYL